MPNLEPMLPAPAANADDALRQALKRCSDATYHAAVEYRRTQLAGSLGLVVQGILSHYLEPTMREKLATLNPTLRFNADLGMDSITKVQAVMLLEEVLQVTIDDRELSGANTLEELIHLLACHAPGEFGARTQILTGTLQSER